MTSLSRRQAIRNAGMAATLPVTSLLLPQLAFGQAASTSAPASSKMDSANPDMVAYVNDRLAKVVAAQVKGEGIVDFSDAIRMLAEHIDDLGIDTVLMPAIQKAVSAGPISFENPLSSATAAAANEAVRKYQPGFDIAATPLSHMLTDQQSLQQALSHLGSIGMGNALRTVADSVRVAAATGAGNLKRASFDTARARSRGTVGAHFQLIEECSAAQKRKLVSDCNGLAGASAAGVLILGTIFCVAITIGVGAALCALILTAGGLFVTGALLATFTAYLFAQCAALGL